ncbi:MAG: DNA polymerase III subunit delta [Bacteroidales bacterium]
MAAITYEQIIAQIDAKKFAPLYFLSGEESYFIDLIVEHIENTILTESEKDFNQTILYGRDTDMNTLISMAKRYPMMAEYQVIVVKEAQVLEKQLDLLTEYLKNPLPSTILVFAYKYKKLDKRKAISKILDKKACVFDSLKLKENQLPVFVQNYVQNKKYRIQHKATLLLIESLGNDLGKIVNELSKLMINIPKETEINDQHIEYFIGISKDYNIFELQNALRVRNVFKAQQIIYYFAENSKEHPIQQIIPVLYSYFLKLLIYHNQVNKITPSELIAAMGIIPYFINDYKILAQNYSYDKSIEIIFLLKEYDLKSKAVDNSSTTSGGELLKELIFKILH